MRCTHCGATVPENARFCAGCGRPLSSSAVSPAQTSPAPASGASKAKWWAIGVGVLVLMAIAFFVGMQSGLITQANVQKPEGPSVLEAQAPKVTGPSVLEAQPPKVESPSVLETEAPPPPPKRVVDWLEHLRKTEERRQRQERNVAPVMSMLVQAMVARAAALGGLRRAISSKRKQTTNASARSCGKATSSVSASGRNCSSTSAACPHRPNAARLQMLTSRG